MRNYHDAENDAVPVVHAMICFNVVFHIDDVTGDEGLSDPLPEPMHRREEK